MTTSPDTLHKDGSVGGRKERAILDDVLASTSSRRQFIRAGALAPFVITGAASTMTGCASLSDQAAHEPSTSKSADSGYHTLDADAVAMWQALLPVMLKLPASEANEQPYETTLHSIDNAIHQFSPFNRSEVLRLFSLLNIRPTRYLTTGLWRDWPEQDEESLRDFLDSWRESRLAVKNQGYNAFTQIAAASAFGQEPGWTVAGYPGPPEGVTNALPQFSGNQQDSKELRV